ncbi:MAG: DUF3014 domain-containing protein [Nitrosomonadales bacterium]|nr:DUF3014 domain-containing protein [Nitrosomonadales bacterium]
MKNPVLIGAIAVILGGGIAAYFYWQHGLPKPEPVQAQAPPPKPVVRQVIETPAASPPLPALAESDSFMLDILDGLIGNKSLMKLFHAEKIIRNIVSTIDNLPRSHAPMNAMPVERAPGAFAVAGKAENDLTIGPKNAARYARYTSIAEAMDAGKLVEIYVRLYPLFQQAYEELGYPNKYFNDRLIEALDNLLDTPVIMEPIKLVQPHVLYQFADPELEGRSIGQRMLMRAGSQNVTIIKARLSEIKQELRLHMHEKKMGSAG